jgi:hypothetical protein
LHQPAFAQEPVVSQGPAVPAQAPGGPEPTPGTSEQPPIPAPIPSPPPAVPDPKPVPVIPDALLIPPATVSSAPQRLLPAPPVGVVPTARFQLESSIAFSEEYTDNFNLTEDDKQSNFRSTVSPGLRLLINGAFLKGLVGYTFSPSHDSSTDDVSLFHSLVGQVSWEINPRWKLTLADTFTRSDQPGEADRLGLRQRRQTFTANTLLLASDYLMGPVATRQSYQLTTFSDEDGEDTKSHIVGLSASVPVYQMNAISGGYEYLASSTSGGTGTGSTTAFGTSGDSDITGHRFTADVTRKMTAFRSAGIRTSYALRTATSRTTDTDFQIWNASLFTDYELPKRLKLTSSLGVSALTVESAGTEGPNLSTKTSLSYEFARTVISLAFDRGFSETFAEGENFGVIETEALTASVAYAFTPFVSATASGFFRRNKTTGVANDSLGGTQQDEETENWGGTLALSWRVRKWLFVELTYDYIRQRGDDNRQTGTIGAGQVDIGNSYTENRVKAAINLSF